MTVYLRGRKFWYVFELEGRRIQESSGFTNKTAALRVEAARRTALLERRAGLKKLKLAPKFEEFVEQFLKWSEQRHRPKTYDLHCLNCQTLSRFFKGKYLDEITTAMVEDFKSARKQERVQWSKKRCDPQAHFPPGGSQRIRGKESSGRSRDVSRTTRLHACHYLWGTNHLFI